ncbi:MAG: rhodanese-like domain-containing protein [Verrucomicrobiota bacterium]
MTHLPDPSETAEVAPQDVAEWLASPQDDHPLVLDCREAEELDICKIRGTDWLPLGRFPESIDSLADVSHRGIVVLCHHGMRSLRAAMFLRSHGIHRAFSMSGGIDAWSRLIDPEVPRY